MVTRSIWSSESTDLSAGSRQGTRQEVTVVARISKRIVGLVVLGVVVQSIEYSYLKIVTTT